MALVRCFLIGFLVSVTIACQSDIVVPNNHSVPKAEKDFSNGGKWTSDLALFEQKFLEVDNSYSTANAIAARKAFSDLVDRAENFSLAEFELAIAEITALADNGHTGISIGAWPWRFNQIPFHFFLEGEKLFIARSTEVFENYVGYEVLSIGKHTPLELIEKWKRYQGGAESRRREHVYYFIESPQLLHAAGLLDTSDNMELMLRSEANEKVELTIEVASAQLPQNWRWSRAFELAKYFSEKKKISSPLYWQNADTAFRFEMIENDQVPYIHFKSNMWTDGEDRIDEFTDGVVAKLSGRRFDNIIVDQRLNFGGDLTSTRDFMTRLPQYLSEQGEIYVLVSGWTFSAGIASVGYLKQSAPEQVIIVGSPMGDRLEFWAEGRPIELPESDVRVFLATERHNYITGCPEKDCHGNIQRYPIQVDHLTPDYLVQIEFDDLMNVHDPAMEKVRNLMKNTK